jgi:hypothetical protein
MDNYVGESRTNAFTMALWKSYCNGHMKATSFRAKGILASWIINP